jgi:cell division protein FtsB
MAATAHDLRRMQNGHVVDGSLAYDLDWAVRERELRHAGEAPRHQERNIVKEEPKVAPRVQVRERQQVSVAAVAGFTAVIAMAVVLLMSYIQLTVVAADTVALKNELSALETEHVALAAEYEQMFDLATVREAAEAAGMSKPSASQICYLDLTGGDHAVVYQKETSSALTHVLTSVNYGVGAVVEYFR